jgi:hypothetical protein
MSAGRKRDPIWNYFTELPANLGKTGCRAKCNECGVELQGLVARMKGHKMKCNGAEELQSTSLDMNDVAPTNELAKENISCTLTSVISDDSENVGTEASCSVTGVIHKSESVNKQSKLLSHQGTSSIKCKNASVRCVCHKNV